MGEDRSWWGLGDWIRSWWSRGVNVTARTDSAHRSATHADRYSKAVRDKRKARRKMANASRRRNR